MLMNVLLLKVINASFLEIKNFWSGLGGGECDAGG